MEYETSSLYYQTLSKCPRALFVGKHPAKLLESSPDRRLVSALESDLMSPLTGMVEMIPNSETLRKIQVEHGVTGSFKDRPLADWLQKHNPGEDEYEKVGLKRGGEAGVGCA